LNFLPSNLSPPISRSKSNVQVLLSTILSMSLRDNDTPELPKASRHADGYFFVLHPCRRGASRHCPRRTANRPGSQRMARYKITDCLQSASAGRHAADGDRPRSGGSIELHPARVAVNISLTSIARHDSISTNHPERNQTS